MYSQNTQGLVKINMNGGRKVLSGNLDFFLMIVHKKNPIESEGEEL